MIDLNNLGKKPYKKEKPKPPKVERTHYMPDEDEIYIGAEFVLRHRKTGKTKVDIYNGHVSPKLYLSRAGISVTKKYLDKEDIESLGLGYDNNAEPIPARDYPHALIPTAYAKEDWMLYHYEHDSVIWIENYKKDSFYFKGTIKNKSELKKLLKQLNICT